MLRLKITATARIWFPVAVAILIWSILRGIRFPNLWSYSHYLFNYHYGFVKRGLVGEIVGLLPHPWAQSYNAFLAFSAVVFVANVILLCAVMRDLIIRGNRALTASALVFASSLGVVFLAHIIGYSDHVGLLATLLTLRIKSFGRKVAFLSFALPACLLIHEATIVIFYPLMFLSLALSIEPGQRGQVAVLGLFSLAMITAAMLVNRAILPADQVKAMFAGLQESTGMGLRRGAFDVLARDPAGNARYLGMIWKRPAFHRDIAVSFMNTGPAIVFFIGYSILILRRANAGAARTIFVVIASASPLALAFIGIDINRWSTLAIVTSFLAWQLTSKAYPVVVINRRTMGLIVLLIVFNLCSSIPLFDGYRVKLFPPMHHAAYIQDVITGADRFPSMPLF